MFGITNITAFILGTIAIVLLPGPNSLFVLTVAVKRGRVNGFRGAFGIFTGDTILMILTVLGAATVLQSHQQLFNLIRYLGAGYLCYLGLGLIWTGIQKWRGHIGDNVVADIEGKEKLESINKLDKPFTRALIISLMNPKAIFFFLSFFLAFIDKTYPHPAVPFLVQAVIVQFFSALYLTALILFGFMMAQKTQGKYRLHSALNIVAGLLFCAYGVNLALMS